MVLRPDCYSVILVLRLNVSEGIKLHPFVDGVYRPPIQLESVSMKLSHKGPPLDPGARVAQIGLGIHRP